MFFVVEVIEIVWPVVSSWQAESCGHLHVRAGIGRIAEPDRSNLRDAGPLLDRPGVPRNVSLQPLYG